MTIIDYTNYDDIKSKYKNFVLEKYKNITYYSLLKEFSIFLEDYGIDYLTMTTKEFSLFQEWLMQKKFTQSKNNHMIMAIRCFYKWLWNTNQIQKDILINCLFATKTAHIKCNKRSFDIIPEKLLMNIIEQETYLLTENPYVFRTVILLIYFSGILNKDLLSLKKEQIDLTNNVISFKNKTLFFPEKIKETLIKCLSSTKGELNAFDLTPYILRNIDRRLKKYKYKYLINFEYLRACFYVNIIKKGGLELFWMFTAGNKHLIKKYWNLDIKKLQKHYTRKFN